MRSSATDMATYTLVHIKHMCKLNSFIIILYLQVKKQGFEEASLCPKKSTQVQPCSDYSHIFILASLMSRCNSFPTSSP